MNADWQAVLTAWKLADAGRWEQATAQSADVPGLSEVIAHRSGARTDAHLPVVAGWQNYQRACYPEAWQHFRVQEGAGWLRAWADLGLAKVASDCGRWRSGLLWCAKAWRCAAAGEHLDLLAEIAGARGEILLRAGYPTEAAASFAEDWSLLPPGNRYRGRVRCYQAHAWSRMGPQGAKAAKLAYRLAAHSAGETPTKSFALAGLSLLNARTGTPPELPDTAGEGIAGFWIKIAQARLAGGSTEMGSLQEEARKMLSPLYHGEHWWLNGWIDGHAAPDALPAALAAGLEEPYLDPEPNQWTAVELPVDPARIADAPWWDFNRWPVTRDGWWALRDAFMP